MFVGFVYLSWDARCDGVDDIGQRRHSEYPLLALPFATLLPVISPQNN
jgi:hypothetical protein